MSKTPEESRAAFAVHIDREPQEVLSIGQQCSAPTCHLIDFLPIKCHLCSEPFCQDHHRPESHQCAKWDPLEADRRAIECPLCKTLIAIPPGEDPNIKIGRHVDSECEVMNGKEAKKSSTPICARPRCDKRLWQPIQCDKCRQKFCATHRHPTAHSCTVSSTPSTSRDLLAPSNPIANASSQMSAKSAAALAAFKRSLPAKPASTFVSRAPSSGPKASAPQAPVPVAATASSSSSASSSSAKPRGNNPFSSKDRFDDSLSANPSSDVTTATIPTNLLPNSISATTSAVPPDSITSSRCAPKSSDLDPLAFKPRPLFGTA